MPGEHQTFRPSRPIIPTFAIFEVRYFREVPGYHLRSHILVIPKMDTFLKFRQSLAVLNPNRFHALFELNCMRIFHRRYIV